MNQLLVDFLVAVGPWQYIAVGMYEDGSEIPVTISEDLQDLIPGYLSNKQNDFEKIKELMGAGDFEAIRIIGHGIKGSGGGYGFDYLTEIGKHLEEAALAGNKAELEIWLGQLDVFLRNVKVSFA